MRKAQLTAILLTMGCVSQDPALRQEHERNRVAVERMRAVEAAQAQQDAEIAAQRQRQHDAQLQAARDAGEQRRRQQAADQQAEAQRKQHAETALADCQAKLDGDLDAGLKCWTEHTNEWQALGIASALVPECIKREQDRAQMLRGCVAKPDKTDDEILEKQACVGSFDVRDPSEKRICAPLSIAGIHQKIGQGLGYDVEKERLDRLAISAKARVERCKGKLAAGLAVKLRVDTSITPSSVSGCTYSIVGKVATTTRDGWAIVELGQDLAIAVKANTGYVDGALLRSDGATFVGVKAFERVDGGTATVASFKISQ
jgi:hypothetical protein